MIEGMQEAQEFENVPGTIVTAEASVVTVLVGDIRDYTGLMQHENQEAVSHSVTRLFEALEAKIWNLGGTVKEFQGDAIVAFWEKSHRADHAVAACQAALKLKDFVEGTAVSPELWSVLGFPLGMDWAVTTGDVTVNAFGQVGPAGLAMLGEPLTLAFRMEKLADDRTGPILVDSHTQRLSQDSMEFTDVGEHEFKGFSSLVRVFALQGIKQPL